MAPDQKAPASAPPIPIVYCGADLWPLDSAVLGLLR
jgi:hypothetical protein